MLILNFSKLKKKTLKEKNVFLAHFKMIAHTHLNEFEFKYLARNILYSLSNWFLFQL